MTLKSSVWPYPVMLDLCSLAGKVSIFISVDRPRMMSRLQRPQPRERMTNFYRKSIRKRVSIATSAITHLPVCISPTNISGFKSQLTNIQSKEDGEWSVSWWRCRSNVCPEFRTSHVLVCYVFLNQFGLCRVCHSSS